MSAKELRFEASKSSGEVSALLLRPGDARWLLVLGHGAGAGMRHPFLEGVCEELARRGVATFRYQFPYMEQGQKRPSPPPVLMATVRSAVATASRLAGNLPVVAGGKSLGGRMTSNAAAQEALPGVRGLVFLGFPLHPAGRPATERAGHLARVPLPMLFVQGTRDGLADLDLLRPVLADLKGRAVLHVVDGGDHSFHFLKRSHKTDGEGRAEIAEAVAGWLSDRVSGPG